MVDLEDPAGHTRVGRPRGYSFKLSRRASTILHGSIVGIIFFQIIFGYLYCFHWIKNSDSSLTYWYSFDPRCGCFRIGPLTKIYIAVVRNVSLPIQIVAYPIIAFMYISTTSRSEEKIVSGAFLGVLALLVVIISVSDGALHVSVMFLANTVALLGYFSWKFYPRVLARLKCLHLSTLSPWREEETGLLTSFRIQELPREFSFGEIRAMTQDFGNMVGQGGSAQVFRGLLDDGTAAAVKQITITSHRYSVDVGEAEFLKEISIIANAHHRSLVRLLGYCRVPDGGGWYLVYPFLQNGSLDRWLFHGEEQRRLLPWPARRRIAVDVARALAYLHHECRRQILHLDIKPGNVLLDGDLRAHVSDFGISVSVARDLMSTTTTASAAVVDTRGRGTFGYMAPEMLVNAVSAKSDVFSYGMMLLELVGGRRNFELSSDESSMTPDFTRDYYPCIVREKMAGGELMEVVDAAMPLVDAAEVEVVVKVALCCIQRHRDMRPTMLTVVDMLEGRVTADLPPESRPPSVVNSSEPSSSTLSSKDR